MLSALLLLSVRPDLDAILRDPELKGASLGAIVCDLSGKVLYQRDPDRRLMPASNEKLISTSFALFKLGPEFRPKTRFWKSGEGLAIDAPGDPLLTDSQLDEAAKKLGSSNATVKVREAYHPYYPGTWQVDDLPNRYAAPVTSFAFNQGAFELWSIGGKPALLPKPFSVTLTWEPDSGKVHTNYDILQGKMVVHGTLPAKNTKIERFAIPQPDKAAASYFGTGFELTDQVPSGQPDLVIEGKPLKEILPACLKNSDNLMAENLLMMAVTNGKYLADPYQEARVEETEFLTKTVGIDPNDFKILDGSGLSRHDIVTPRMLAKLLRWADRQPTRELWQASLVNPASGTLQNRLTGVRFEGKTGTLDMAVALSGYIHRANGQVLIVSLIVNQFVGSSDGVRAILDRFVRKVSEQG